jgi:hypothetical protein
MLHAAFKNSANVVLCHHFTATCLRGCIADSLLHCVVPMPYEWQLHVLCFAPELSCLSFVNPQMTADD